MAYPVPMELPTCGREGHGRMQLRPLSWQTYEQRFCGVWYDCPHCHSSVLFPSKELEAQLAEQRLRASQLDLPLKQPKPSKARSRRSSQAEAA